MQTKYSKEFLWCGSSSPRGILGRFQKGVFVRGKISTIGVVRTPVSKIDFASLVRELSVESYANSEIFHKDLTLLEPVRARPLFLRSPRSQKPHFVFP